MLMRYDPFREFERLATEMMDQVRTPRTMPMDAWREGDDLVVHLDLPGVDAGSIDLTVERNVLNVSARRTLDRTAVDQLFTSERPQGFLQRQIFLGEGLDSDQLEAEYSDGVLRIRVPVLESARPRRVPITTGSGRTQAIEAEDRADTAA